LAYLPARQAMLDIRVPRWLLEDTWKQMQVIADNMLRMLREKAEADRRKVTAKPRGRYG